MPSPPNTREEAPLFRDLVFYNQVIRRDPQTGGKLEWVSHIGKKGDTPLTFYPHVDFNLFSTVPRKLTKSFERQQAISRRYIRDRICDPSKKHAVSRTKKVFGKWYLVHDNGDRPFAVRVYRSSSDSMRNTVEVYKHDPSSYIWEHEHPRDLKWYTYIIQQWNNVEKVFIGKSPLNPSTRFSGGYGKAFDGNSIMVYVGSTQGKNKKHKYVFIGESIVEFTFPERITSFTSPVGNNDVPYATAYSRQYVLFFAGEYVYGSRKDVVRSLDLDTKERNDTFFDYYGHGVYTEKQKLHQEEWRKTVKKLPQLHVIHKRKL